MVAFTGTKAARRPAPPLRSEEAQSRLARPFSSSASVSKAERPGLRFSGSSRLASCRLWFCNLCAAAPVFYLTPRSKSFPPRRDARNANNQTSAPARAGLGERWGAPGPSRVHPRAGPGGDTKKPGTPTPTAGARRDPQGAPPAAKFVAPREPRCPRPAKFPAARLGAPHPEVLVGPRAPRPDRGTRWARARPFPALPLPKGALGCGGSPQPRSPISAQPGGEDSGWAHPDLRPARLAASMAPLDRSPARSSVRPKANSAAERALLWTGGCRPRPAPPGLPSPALAAARAARCGRSRLPVATATFPPP
ncbi:hypothetical protein ACRRTK_017463 [Alexandromys fortis]